MANLQLKDLNIEKNITIELLELPISKHNLSIIQFLVKIKHIYNQNRNNNTINNKKSRKPLDIENVIKKVQKDK